MIHALNPGIVNTVAWLQSKGLQTVDSGDGKTHDFECDRDHAYVVMVVKPADLAAEADRLMALLRLAGIEVKAHGPEGTTHPAISASYDPGNGVAILDLMYVDDAILAAANVTIPT